MRHIFVRPATPGDAQNFTDWFIKTPNNLHDCEVIKYPSTITLCAYNKEGPVAYVPVQFPAMLESLAINPDASFLDVAVALKELVQAVVTQCHVSGRGEAYFVCCDQSTIDFAVKNGFEEMKHKVFRMKLSDLEGKECASTPKS